MTCSPHPRAAARRARPSLLLLAALSALLLGLGGACAGAGMGDAPGGLDAGDELADADPAAPDAPPEPDAMPPQTATPPKVVGLAAPGPIVAHGFAVTLTVVLDLPAPAGGVVVTLTSDDTGGHLALPASVPVPAGMSQATVQVGGMAMGGPYTITATLDSSSAMTALRVVPALTQLGPAAADLTVGAGGQYTLTLEAPAPVAFDVTLASTAPQVASLAPSITVPQGAAQVAIMVNGVGLGGPATLTASAGGQSVSATARVLGVYLSEVFYDAPSTDTGLEWVELYNASAVAIDVTGMKITSANSASGYVPSLTLAGTLAPGQCVVVGGPSNAGVSFFQAVDLNPDLGNVSNGNADGVSLATAAGAVVDNVLYGGANADGLTDENGQKPASADVGDAAEGQSIERTAPGLAGPWQIQATPSPGNCTPIAS